MSKPDYQNNPFVSYFPPGHYYSPLPDLDEVVARSADIWTDELREFPGIELNCNAQIELLVELSRMAEEYPFPAAASPELRYHYDNTFFPLTDGAIYHFLLRHWRPRRVMEIGSGFSSALLLDTRDEWLPQLECYFIEPDTSRLRSLLRAADREVHITQERLQDCNYEIFEGLEAGDVLFVDSSHVSKIGSDVNEIFFKLLPRLNRGVYVHFHDIYHPFEYPREWLEKGWAWNEAYLLRAFLQYNKAFEVLLWNRFFTTMLYESVPECLRHLLKPRTGGSIWLRKVD